MRKLETLKQARSYLKKVTRPDYDYGLSVYHRRGSKAKKSYLVCTYIEWLNQ